jgi:DNA-binding response OmpR family regulator
MTRPSVLIIDRDQLFLDLITQQLTTHGINPVIATSCSRGRFLMATTPPDVVLLDASLAGSVDLIKAIRANDQPTAVIARTDSAELWWQVSSVGVEVVLDRSIQVDGVYSAMRQIMGDEDDEELES